MLLVVTILEIVKTLKYIETDAIRDQNSSKNKPADIGTINFQNSSNLKLTRQERTNEATLQSSTTMFAAAAVAAAAALTAISTTQSPSQLSTIGNGASSSQRTAQIPTPTALRKLVPIQQLPSQSYNFNQKPLLYVGQNNQNANQYQRWNTYDPSPSPSLARFHAASSARSLDAYSAGSLAGQNTGINQLDVSDEHVGSYNLSPTSPSRNYISWKQYAMQRRNSMQRRKIEISRRLEQASNANQKKSYNIQQFQASKPKSTDLSESIPSRRSLASEGDSNRFKRQNTIATTDSQDTSSNEQWLRQMSARICNEFIRMQKSGLLESDDPDALDNLDLLKKIDLSMHPTYKNFDIIAQLMQIKGGDTSSFDFEKISQAMYEYLRTLNITQESFLDPTSDSLDGASSLIGVGATVGINLFDDGDLSSLGNVRHCLNKETLLAQQLRRRKEEKLNFLITHRWDPQWLRSLRTNFCIPFAIFSLILLIFTNLNTNWIRFDNIRAGLWSVCNTTRHDSFSTNLRSADSLIMLNQNETISLIVSTSTSIPNALSALNTSMSSNFFSKGIQKASKILIKNHEVVEDCYSKFFLQEDTHLAIVSLALISLLFHLIGTALLIIGFISSLSQRSLYFYHSAGECLVTSAIVHIIELTAFSVVVRIQNINQSFRLGSCFYINVFIAILTLTCSILLHLDDLVNEWKIWKVKTDCVLSTQILNHKSTNIADSNKPADIFLSSI